MQKISREFTLKYEGFEAKIYLKISYKKRLGTGKFVVF